MATTRRIRLSSALVPIILVTTPAWADTDPAGVWPLRPRPALVRPFEPPSSQWGAGHRGVDLEGTAGQSVRSALAGTVVYAGLLAGRGVVVVDHGATRTTYEPVVATVEVGDRVARGDRIAGLAVAGSHCLPRTCLHWGLIVDAEDSYLDPLSLVSATRVRLLPLWPEPASGALGPIQPSRSNSPVGQTLARVVAQARGWACW